MLRNEFEFNGNKIEVIETEKGYDVRIIGDKNIDIYINNECIYSEYDDEAYKYIPVNMREFVKKYADNIELDDFSDTKGTSVDMYICGNDVTMYFSKNKSNKIHARFSLTVPLDDTIELLDDYEYESDVDRSDIKTKVTKLYNDMTEKLKNIGYELIYSHSMNESFWGWHDIVFSQSEFKEDYIIQVSRIIEDYNESFESIIREYDLF